MSGSAVGDRSVGRVGHRPRWYRLRFRACPIPSGSTRPRTIPRAANGWSPRSAPLGVDYELFPCDPALADTAAFCAAYGFAPEESANTILVIGKSDPPRYAACVVLAPNRLDVNRAVRDRLGTRKASFAPSESTREITGMEIGGVTVFGLPADCRSGSTPA